MEQIRFGEAVPALDCAIDFTREPGYLSVINDAHLTKLAVERIRARFGEGRPLEIGRIMPGEDYAYFLDGRPGFFVELGARIIIPAVAWTRTRSNSACNTSSTWRRRRSAARAALEG